MAQEVNARPVLFEQGQGAQNFADSLAYVAAQKSAQQKAIRDAELQRQKDLNDIYEKSSKELIEYYDKGAASGGRDIADAELKTNLKNLAAGLKQRAQDLGGAREFATGIVADVSQRAGRIKDFYEGVNKTVTELAAQGYDPNAIKTFIGKNIESRGGVSPDVVKTLGNPTELIMNEISNSPELYVNRAVIRGKANQEIESLFKNSKDIGTKLTMDPTGTKAITLGTKGAASIFDQEIEETDPLTGLKYKKPVLRSEIIKAGNSSFNVLPEDSFELIMQTASPATKNEILIGAIDKIKENNKKALSKAGLPENAALTVTRSNADKFLEVPGFINPFDEGEVEKFKRVHALDLVQKSGRYDDKGNSSSFAIVDRGIKKDNPPRTTVNINNGQSGTFVDAFENANQAFKSATVISKVSGKNRTPIGRAINSFPSDIAEIFVSKANSASEKKVTDELGGTKTAPFKQEDLVVTKTADGNFQIVVLETGEKIPPITKEELNKAYNGEVSPKAKASAVAAAGKENKQPTNPKKKLY